MFGYTVLHVFVITMAMCFAFDLSELLSLVPVLCVLSALLLIGLYIIDVFVCTDDQDSEDHPHND